MEPGASIIVNTDAFNTPNLTKAGYTSNPLEDGTLKNFRVYEVPITTLNRNAVKDVPGLSPKEIDRSQNFFALGLVYWIYDRPLENTIAWIKKQFARRPEIVEANIRALQAGYNFGDTTEAFQVRYRCGRRRCRRAPIARSAATRRWLMGLVTAARKAGKTLFYGSYPITPASDILHFLAGLRHFEVLTFQAEDEIAAMEAAIGAAFGGAFAVTGTSGPGLALKSEGINLAVMLELPMVIIDVQRGGPSTGLPTKAEQADLLQALFGRNGESPLPVVAPATPAECFDFAIEAFRLAVRAMSPVILLSDGYLANSAEPWKIPDPANIPPIVVEHPHSPNNGKFLPYKRDPVTLNAAVGHPRHPRPGTSRGRFGEIARCGECLLCAARSSTHGQRSCRQGSPSGRHHPRTGSVRSAGRRAVGGRLGQHLRRYSRGCRSGPGQRPVGSPCPHPLSQSLPP